MRAANLGTSTVDCSQHSKAVLQETSQQDSITTSNPGLQGS